MHRSGPFGTRPETRIARRDAHARLVPDAHPVSPGHSLIEPLRLVAPFLNTTPEARAAVGLRGERA